MPGVFLSSQALDRAPARALAEALHSAGVGLECSPTNPVDGEDSRWANWYSAGLARAIRASDAAVLVLDEAWDSSTWMAEEAHQALTLLGADAVFFWNPNNVQVRAVGMLPFLKTRLPDPVAEAVASLSAFLSA
jgi:hypothetical protein